MKEERDQIKLLCSLYASDNGVKNLYASSNGVRKEKKNNVFIQFLPVMVYSISKHIRSHLITPKAGLSLCPLRVHNCRWTNCKQLHVTKSYLSRNTGTATQVQVTNPEGSQRERRGIPLCAEYGVWSMKGYKCAPLDLHKKPNLWYCLFSFLPQVQKVI